MHDALTIAEAARALGTTVWRLRRRVRRGDVQTISRPGSAVLRIPADLIAVPTDLI